MQKFSSNVIEKCLEKAPKVSYMMTLKQIVIKYLRALQEQEVMKSLIKNNYGFYVVHKILNVLGNEPMIFEELSADIEKNLQYVGDKSLRQKWMNLMQGKLGNDQYYDQQQ